MYLCFPFEFPGSSGYESTTTKQHKDDEEVPKVSRVKRPSVTITSPGSPGMTRRNSSPSMLGEIQVHNIDFQTKIKARKLVKQDNNDKK